MTINQYPAEDLRSVDRDLLEAMLQLAADGGNDDRGDSVGVGQLTDRLGVTATAVRQRIDRLMEMGLIEREKIVQGRGRPTYRYRLTIAGQRRCGANPIDIADAMWREILAISDLETRRGLIAGVAERLGKQYAAQMQTAAEGATFLERMQQLSQLLASRHMSVEVSNSGDLPVLDVCNCPYPSLTDSSEERAMCHLEEQMISEALGQEVHLSSCCLDGDTHCQFTVASDS